MSNSRGDLRSTIGRLSCGLAAVILIGCEDEEQIRSYHVPRAGVAAAGDATASPQMLLGAIVPHGGQSWFFKAVGPPHVVEPERQNFRQFVRSLQFPDGEKVAPTWTLPEGWTQQVGSGMRYATLRFGPDESTAELTAIALPTPDEGDDSYLLSNVNRWREQLQLSPIDGEQLASEIEVIPLGKAQATLVQMQGVGTGGMAAKPTAHGMSRRATPSAAAPHPDIAPHPDVSPHPDMASTLGGLAGSEPVELKYTVPEGWSEEKVSGMRKAAFTVAEGEQAVEITVIDLLAGAGELLPNVNRWRGQIQLGETTAEELAKETEKICVGAAVGDYVSLEGPKDAERPQTILAAVVLRGGKSWFIKLMGDSNLAAQEEERFKSFARSVHF